MYRGHTVGVVVPAYDEEGFVADVLADVPEFVDWIYAVDDCSTDGTWDEILEFAREEHERADGAVPATVGGDGPTAGVDRGGRVVPIRHETNRGAGAAIKTGYRQALADDVDVTVTIDADGQMDPAQMSRVVDPIVDGLADYAKGNRLVSPGARGEMPTLRWVGNWMLTVLTKVASGYWRIRDPQNGYTAISLRALRAIDVDAIYDYYGYSNDVLVRLNGARMRVADVVMPAAYGDEESSIRLRSYVPKVSGLLGRRFLWRLRVRYVDRRFHPPAVCYAGGFVGAVAALLYWIATAATGSVGGWIAAGASSVAPVLVVCGLLLTIGMVLDRWENRGLEVRLE